MSSSPIHGGTPRSPNTVVTVDPSTQKTIYAIKEVATTIREASSRMREVVRAVHQSGAIDELATAVHEAMIAARDTTNEINETAKALKERGVIRDAAINVEETTAAARQIGETVKRTTQEVGEAAPRTAETLRNAGSRLKTKRDRSSSK